MPVFESSVPLSCSREQIWEFLVRPANVLKILPPDAGMSFINVPDRLELGSHVEFKIEGMGPTQHVLHKVTAFEPLARFVESQVKGPLKAWDHDHRLEDHSDGILLIDRVEFEPPGGLIGFVVTEQVVYGWLESGFAHRHKALQELCAQGDL